MSRYKTINDVKEAIAKNEVGIILSLPKGSKIPELIEFLTTNPAIEKLSLFNNKLGDGNIKSIFDALKNNRTIESVDIDRNDVSDVSVNYLAELLYNSDNFKNLKTLSMSGNNVSRTAARSIALARPSLEVKAIATDAAEEIALTKEDTVRATQTLRNFDFGSSVRRSRDQGATELESRTRRNAEKHKASESHADAVLNTANSLHL
ncbi:MAG: hypothetical protein K0R98_200 [Rickettsiaceae bacterium]|jgi:Leucine-rich repeat (LRR) protein|nr:hypothetical protein [Rickettsiaceae bacterium]